VDIGTGDGAFVYKWARACPDRLFIGIDSNAANLAEYSRKATRKPAKGGVRNVLFVRANSEALPEELNGLVSAVSILFPWGSLLKSVVVPDERVLSGFCRICRAHAEINIVFGYNHICEPGITAKLDLPTLTLDYLRTTVVNTYKQAGFAMKVRQLEKAEVAKIPTTWAKKLAHGKNREFFELHGRLTMTSS
jgi:16S rRNA (adenine(1408)-N(1))-methyltransferase